MKLTGQELISWMNIPFIIHNILPMWLKLLLLLKSDVLPNTAARYNLLLPSLILCLKLLSLTAFWHLEAYRKSTSSWSQGWKAPTSMLLAFQWINPITLRLIFSCILLWRHFRKQFWLLNKSIFLRTGTGLNKIHMRSTSAERCVPTFRLMEKEHSILFPSWAAQTTHNVIW